MLFLSISFCSCILQELNQLVLRKDCSLQLWSLPLILFLLTLLILTVVSFLIYNLFLILGIFFNFLTQLLILYQTKGLPKLPKYFITLDFQNFWNLLCVWNSKKIYLLFIDQRVGLSPKLPWYSLVSGVFELFFQEIRFSTKHHTVSFSPRRVYAQF